MRTRDVRYLYYSQREVRAVGGRPFAQESAASGVPSGRLTAAALSRACANAHGLEGRTHSTIRTLGRHDAGSPVARLSFRAALSRHDVVTARKLGIPRDARTRETRKSPESGSEPRESSALSSTRWPLVLPAGASRNASR